MPVAPLGKHVSPILLALAGGLFLVFLSVPQLVGGLKLFWHERTLDRIAGANLTRPVTPAILADAVVSWREAAGWLDDSRIWTEYGDVLMAAARAAGTNAQLRKERLEEAVRAYHAAIARGPADARAWTMLAAARIELEATPEEIIPLLRMSLRTGPREPGLAYTRLDIAFYLWRILGDGLKAAMADQVLIATRHDIMRLVNIVRRHYLLGPVRAMLDADPVLKWRFDQMYMRLYP
jgi:hypothetical protein